MNKVLVFCSDILPLDGLATSGGGLRSWQIVKGLEAEGFNVVYSMPWNRFLRREFSQSIPAETRERMWTDQNQDSIIKGEKPDVIVCAKPASKTWKQKHDIPTAIDFHGPDLIEFEQQAGVYMPQARFTLASRKLQTISQADFFTCAGRRQRFYFIAFMIMAGVEISDLDVHYMPVALSSDLPEHTPDLDSRTILFSGGFYPWLDPMPALRTLSEELISIGKGRLDVYGGSHHTNPVEKREYDKFKADLMRNPLVKFHGYVPRQSLLDAFRKGFIAFELMPHNIEREMAFTTRTVEFLWAGLPVIYNEYAELSELISDYGAGWLVPAKDRVALGEILRRILDSPEEVAAASQGAQKLVRENLVYSKVIGPLAEFCRNPRHRRPSEMTDFLFVPSNKAGFGYIDHIYSYYKRYRFFEFTKSVITSAAVVAKTKLVNFGKR